MCLGENSVNGCMVTSEGGPHEDMGNMKAALKLYVLNELSKRPKQIH